MVYTCKMPGVEIGTIFYDLPVPPDAIAVFELKQVFDDKILRVSESGYWWEAPPPAVDEQHVTKQNTQLARATAFIAAAYTGYSDSQAFAVKEIFSVWPSGTDSNGKYQKNRFLLHENRLYQVVQETAPQQDQPPNAEGMLAIYRPIDTVHAGTRDDPIPFAYGMDCHEKLYYLYSGMVYQCRADMLPCVWAPDTPGLWQWALT